MGVSWPVWPIKGGVAKTISGLGGWWFSGRPLTLMFLPDIFVRDGAAKADGEGSPGIQRQGLQASSVETPSYKYHFRRYAAKEGVLPCLGS